MDAQDAFYLVKASIAVGTLTEPLFVKTSVDETPGRSIEDKRFFGHFNLEIQYPQRYFLQDKR